MMGKEHAGNLRVHSFHWHDAILDAILDRLAHNAHRLTLTGDSMRKAAAKRSGLDASPAP